MEPTKPTLDPRGAEGGAADTGAQPAGSSRELALVRRVTDRLVASIDFREALTTLIDGATELLGVERGSILVLDAETSELRIEVARGLDPEIVPRVRIPLGTGIAGGVAASGEAVVARDVRQLPGFRLDPEKASDYADFSALCVPLVLHGRVLGVMNFNHKRSGLPFDERDLEFALLIANQASIVLWSAQLHREYLEKQVLDREVEIARSIQQRLLARELPEIPHFAFAARQVMCTGVGGDYYDFVQLHDGQLALVVGDAAGHGLGSALVAVQVRATLHECLARGDRPTEALARISDRVNADTASGMYMTMLFGLLDPAAHFFEFATTGHHMPILVRDGRVTQPRAVGKNLPLGIRRGQRFQLEFPLGLRKHDLLLMFTDGLWEATDARGQEFASAGVVRTLERCRGARPDDVLRVLVDAVNEHCGGELEDDLTLVAIRVEEDPPEYL